MISLGGCVVDLECVFTDLVGSFDGHAEDGRVQAVVRVAVLVGSAVVIGVGHGLECSVLVGSVISWNKRAMFDTRF